MSKVTMADNCGKDGKALFNHGEHETKVEYSYVGGYFDRAVKESYGYAEVTAEYPDKNKKILLFYNDQYYNKGMKKSSKFCIASILIMLTNIIALFATDYFIGGNATNGKVEKGIYYVMTSDENFKEVSKYTFVFSYVISCISTLSIAVGIPATIIMQFRAVNSSFMKGGKE